MTQEQSSDIVKNTYVDVKITIPEKYSELSPLEKREVLRSAILTVLNRQGQTTGISKSELKSRVDPSGNVNYDTFGKALEHLITTQQIYLDAAPGGRDPILYPNGRMAHPKLHKMIDTLLSKYVIRAYDNRFGKTITITQYAKTFSGEERATGGIRVDWQDLDEFIRMLQAESKALKEKQGIGEDGL